jgi:uncharacterized protein (DUF58 family)
MRPWQVLLVILGLGFFALTSGWKVLYILTYAVLALFILSWFWARYSLRQLAFRRTWRDTANLWCETHRLQRLSEDHNIHRDSALRLSVGEVFDETLMLDNISVLPRPWVQIVDGSTLPGHHADYVASMGGRQRVIWRASSTCRQRGQFQLGPISACSGDPFGLFRRRICLTHPHRILVLPRVYPLTQFALFNGGLPGRGRSSQRALQATTNVTGVREYLTGDAFSRVHWRSSARHNKLMVKEFDLDPAVDVWIFLDLQESVQVGDGEQSTEEYGVTIAATIAHYLLRQSFAVGMIVNSGQWAVLSLDRGERQIERVLELLTIVSAGDGPSLRESFVLDGFQFGRNTVAIVITPSNACDWHEGLQLLQRRGVQVSVVGIDATSFDGRPPEQDNLALLEGVGISVVRVKCKDSLVQVLESGSNIPPL